MTPDLSTFAAALLFAATFLWGRHFHPLQPLFPDRRVAVSFGAGMSAAYVFVHLMPELHGIRTAFAESVSMPLRYEGMIVYYVGLIGFLFFYGLDVLRERLVETDQAEEAHVGRAFKLHVGGFAAYVFLMGTLLVHNLEETSVSTAFYAASIAVHFLSVDHALRDEYGVTYDRVGRPLLAAMSVLGWGTGQLINPPIFVTAPLVAFISGAIIMNSTIMELPTEKEGRFMPFVAGGLIYGLILIPIG